VLLQLVQRLVRDKPHIHCRNRGRTAADFKPAGSFSVWHTQLHTRRLSRVPSSTQGALGLGLCTSFLCFC
jgi:hypothetical protein